MLAVIISFQLAQQKKDSKDAIKSLRYLANQLPHNSPLSLLLVKLVESQDKRNWELNKCL